MRSITGRGKSRYKTRSYDGVALTCSNSSKETRMVGMELIWERVIGDEKEEREMGGNHVGHERSR